MVRIFDGIPINPVLIISGWIASILVIAILIRLNPEFNNDELAEYATLGAYVFVLQTIPIPLKVVPVVLTLSGVPLVIMVKGVKRGLLISASAIFLNHALIPGSLSMLGIDMINMLFAGFVAGLVPSYIYRKMGKRVRYLSGFIAGIIYFAVISVLIVLEMRVSTVDISVTNIAYLFLFAIFILGLLEGFLTAIGSSYYYRSRQKVPKETIEEEASEQDDELELIRFLDDD